MDCSPSGSSVHGIFQARVLEWGAIAFSDNSHYPCLLHPGRGIVALGELRQVQSLNDLGFNPGPTPFYLCDTGQLT